MESKAKLISMSDLSDGEVRYILDTLLDKLGYEVRVDESTREKFLCEQVGMSGAKGEYNDYD